MPQLPTVVYGYLVERMSLPPAEISEDSVELLNRKYCKELVKICIS